MTCDVRPPCGPGEDPHPGPGSPHRAASPASRNAVCCLVPWGRLEGPGRGHFLQPHVVASRLQTFWGGPGRPRDLRRDWGTRRGDGRFSWPSLPGGGGSACLSRRPSPPAQTGPTVPARQAGGGGGGKGRRRPSSGEAPTSVGADDSTALSLQSSDTTKPPGRPGRRHAHAGNSIGNSFGIPWQVWVTASPRGKDCPRLQRGARRWRGKCVECGSCRQHTPQVMFTDTRGQMRPRPAALVLGLDLTRRGEQPLQAGRMDTLRRPGSDTLVLWARWRAMP